MNGFDPDIFEVLPAYVHRYRGGGGSRGRRGVVQFADTFTPYGTGRLTTQAPAVWQTFELDFSTADDFATIIAGLGGGIVYDLASINAPTQCVPFLLGPTVGAADPLKGYTLTGDVTISASSTANIAAGVDWEIAPGFGPHGVAFRGYKARLQGDASGFTKLLVQDPAGGPVYFNFPDIGSGAGVVALNVPHTIRVTVDALPAAGNRRLRVWLDNVNFVDTTTIPRTSNGSGFGCHVQDFGAQRACLNKFTFDGLR